MLSDASRLPAASLDARRPAAGRVGYVLKMYPRFSETFIVSEILAREAAGETLAIYSLRPPVDPRFHPELARVAAPVTFVERPGRPSALWAALGRASTAHPALAAGLSARLPELLAADVDDAVQAVLLAEAALADGITHLHAHFASMATTVARLASLLTGIPYSFTAHAKDLFHESVDPVDIARKLRDAHHTITVSGYNDQHLRREFPLLVDRLHHVYNGLELDRFPYEPRRRTAGSPLRVVAVGRLVEKKGFALLIDAAAALALKGVAVDVRIAGGGELAADLAAQVVARGLEHSVRLLGPLPQNEVRDLIASADVFAAPCIVAADGNADGLPTVILEALALGVPCIATDVTGIPEVIRDGETGLLCGAGSIADLVRALLAVDSPGFDGDGITRRARRLVEREFDSARQADRLRGLRGGDGPATRLDAAGPGSRIVEVA